MNIPSGIIIRAVWCYGKKKEGQRSSPLLPQMRKTIHSIEEIDNVNKKSIDFLKFVFPKYTITTQAAKPLFSP